MKNLFKSFLAVVALAVVGCTTDTTEDLGVQFGNGDGQTTITLSLDGTRTHLGAKGEEGYPLYWSKGDQIAVNGVASAALGEEADGQSAATFTFESELTAPYNVVYPAPAKDVTATLDGHYPVVFPATQEYVEGSFASGAAPMYGYAGISADGEEVGAIKIGHLTGVLRLAVKGDATLRSLTITAEKGSIAGTFDVDCKSGTLAAQEGASNTIAMEFDGGLKLSEEEATPIYVTIPAGEYGKLEIMLSTIDGIMKLSFDSSAKPIKAGVVREFSEITYQTTISEESTYLIDSKEALIQFASIAADFAPYTTAKVIAPIDMTGVEWTPVENFGAYTFDGGDMEIKGLTAPLFGTTAAIIKNVKLVDVAIVETVDVFCGSIARRLFGVLNKCSAQGTLTVNNTTYTVATATGQYDEVAHGGLVGIADGATIYNCESDVDVTITSFCASKIKSCAGGAVGAVVNGVKMNNVTNNGNVVYNGTAHAQNAYFSGVVGKSANTAIALAEFSNITNNGSISTTADSKVSGDVLFSGIIGDIVLANATDICDNLVNNGDITHNGYINGTRLAGIAAYTCTGSFTNCKNTGDLTIATGARHTSVYLGGLFSNTVTTKTFTGNVNEGALTIQDPAKEDLTFKHGYIQVCGIAQCITAAGGTESDIPTVSGCINRGPLFVGKLTNATTGNGGRLYMAGLFANINAGNYSNCVNEATGTITAKTGSWAAEHMIGGFVTYLSVKTGISTIKITDCENKAAILDEPYIDENNKLVKGEIGGFCAEAYANSKADTYHIEFLRAKNSGDVTIKGEYTTSGHPYAGGFLGTANYDTLIFEDCEVSGDTTMDATAISACIGGFIGYDSTNWELQMDGCVHSGNLTYSALALTATGDDASVMRLGGLVGLRNVGVTTVVKNCANTGAVSVLGDQTATVNAAKDKGDIHAYCVGGIFGINSGNNLTIENCTNGEEGSATKGAITVGGTPQSGLALGGIMGLTTNHFNATGCKNYGPIKQTGAGGASATYRSSIGGILGAAPNDGTSTITITNCENYGNIGYGSVKPTHRVDVGGIMGTSSQKGTTTITGCKNGGKIEYNATGATVEISIGGIGGTIQSGNLHDCVNLATGEIYSNGSTSSNYNAAGVVGSTALNSVNIYNCDNYGHINQIKASAGVTQIGGVVGYAYRFGTIDGCNNFGTITFAGTATSKNGNVGGVIGHARFQGANAAADGSTPAGVVAVTNCGNYADQTWGGTASTYYAGGVIGYCRSKESGEAKLENLKNIANLTFESKGSSDANTYLGGICGTFGSEEKPHHIDGGVFYGDFKALDLGLEHLVGLAFGNFRTATRRVTNVQFGGNVIFKTETGTDAAGNEETAEVKIPITADNLHHYIYKYNGENPSVTQEELASDNCTVITTKPAVPAN